MCPSAPRVCSEPGGQKPVLSLSLDLIDRNNCCGGAQLDTNTTQPQLEPSSPDPLWILILPITFPTVIMSPILTTQFITLSFWYKTKFGSQILATKFGFVPDWLNVNGYFLAHVVGTLWAPFTYTDQLRLWHGYQGSFREWAQPIRDDVTL